MKRLSDRRERIVETKSRSRGQLLPQIKSGPATQTITLQLVEYEARQIL